MLNSDVGLGTGEIWNYGTFRLGLGLYVELIGPNSTGTANVKTLLLDRK